MEATRSGGHREGIVHARPEIAMNRKLTLVLAVLVAATAFFAAPSQSVRAAECGPGGGPICALGEYCISWWVLTYCGSYTDYYLAL